MDDLAFTRAWIAAQPAVASVLTALVWDVHAVDDLLQEVAAAAFADRARYGEDRSFTAWAIGIARHKAIDWLRRQGRQPLAIREPAALDAIAGAADELAPELAERELALHRCLSRLDAHARRLVDLHYGEGLTPAAIAGTLRRTANQVRVALHRIRAALRTCVERATERA